MKKLNYHGDTLVEVLIATVIIGFVLVGGFVAVNHNVTVELQAQERSTALQLNQTQIERLRTLVDDGTVSLASIKTTQSICVTDSGGGKIILFTTDLATNTSNCNFDTQGTYHKQPVTSGINYQITISAVNGTWNQVEVKNSWTESGSTGSQSTAILAYHFYPTPGAR